MKYYPLFMDVEDRECLVVGAGSVAARKARALMSCGARVTVIGEKPVASLRRLEKRGLKIRARRFREADMKRYTLVFGATDDAKLNGELARRSREQGIPVNIVDDPARSTFIVPSVYRRGPLSVAVSTSGASPALARLIREDLGRHLGRDYAELATLLGRHRRRVMEAVPGQRRRAALWKRILSADVLGVLRRRGRRGAEEVIQRHIEAAQGGRA